MGGMIVTAVPTMLGVFLIVALGFVTFVTFLLMIHISS
jgi:hypothetical protein